MIYGQGFSMRVGFSKRLTNSVMASGAVLALGAVPVMGQEAGRDGATEEQAAEESSGGAIIVTGTRQSRYVVGATSVISGVELDFLENPRSVTILPEQLLLDRKITEIEEALRNAPGVNAGDGFGGTRDDFFIRGFRRNAEYRDGFRRQTGFKTNLSNVERIEVIRGPAAITFGQVSPGGVVNVVTKRPLDARRLSGEFRYGSFDDILSLIDWSQPVSDDVAVRLVGSIKNANSFRDFTDIDRDAFAISARFDVSDRTAVGLAYEYRYESRPLDRGTLALPTPGGFVVANKLLGISFSRRFGEPFEDLDLKFHYVEGRLTHAFNDKWRLRAALAYEASRSNDLQARLQNILVADANDARISSNGFVSSGVDPAALVAELRDRVFDDPTDRVFLHKQLDGSRNRNSKAVHANLFLNGELETGSLRHRISVGADYRDSEQTRQLVIGAQTDGITTPFFNLATGDYVLPGGFATEGVPVDIFDNKDYGFFFNSYTDITDRLGLLLGIRYAKAEAQFLGREQRSSGWVPQAGLTYLVSDDVSLYASYAQSFMPNNAIPLGSGQFKPIDPQEGDQYEIGAKAELLGGRLQAQAAAYRISLTNVFSGTDANFNPIFVDGQTSEGVELTLTGQPFAGMNVTTSYAYTDARLDDGNRAASVPKHSANLYASYEVQSGVLEGLGMGGGLFYESNRFGNNANTFELGGITLVDASLWYTIAASRVFGDDGTVRFQIAVKNIFDKEYFSGTSSPDRIPLGTPRTVYASISFDI